MPEITRRTVRQDDTGKAGQARGAAPLASLDARNNKFLFSSINYPIDIEKLSHAMLFNINIQESSEDRPGGSVSREQLPDPNFEILGSRQQVTTKKIQSGFFGSYGLTKRTKRIKRAISLYVPETIVFDDRQDYETPSLMDKYGIGGAAAVSTMSAAGLGPSAAVAGIGAAGLTAAAIPLIAAVGMEAVGSAALSAAGMGRIFPSPTKILKTTAQIFGYALNPVIEVLYSGPRLRSFNFDFTFAPRNQQEADAVWSIIYEFRRHAAPEIFAKGLLLVPPSEFEITFLRKTPPSAQTTEIGGRGYAGGSFVENTNMPRISTCVLRNVQVDYASAGSFVTFDDGMPIQIRMRLEMQETQQLTKEAIDMGY